MERLRVSFIVLIACVIAGGGAFAHSGATGVVKQRMDAMVDVGRNMKTIAAMMKGETPFDTGVVAASALAIAGHARNIPDLFPEGTGKMPSEATAAVWQDWTRFARLAAEMEASAMSLADAARTARGSADIRGQMAAVGRSCKACHQRFRLKK